MATKKQEGVGATKKDADAEGAEQKPQMTGAISFGGTVYLKGQEDELEAALDAHEKGVDGMSAEQKAARKAEVTATRENLAKQGVYGDVTEHGTVVQPNDPDSTLRAGALGRDNDPLGSRGEGHGQQATMVRTGAVDATENVRAGAQPDQRTNSTVHSEGAGGAAINGGTVAKPVADEGEEEGAKGGAGAKASAGAKGKAGK